jgi:WD40 repeat protein
MIVSGLYDNIVKIWDASSSACLKTLKGHSGLVNSVAFLHNSKMVVSGSYDYTVKIWDASSSACLKTLKGHSCLVSSVAFLHNSKMIVSRLYDYTVKIWDASSGACLKTLKSHGQAVYNVVFDTTGSYLLTSIGTILWDISSDSNTTLAATALEKPWHHGYGLNADQAWITWNG